MKRKQLLLNNLLLFLSNSNKAFKESSPSSNKAWEEKIISLDFSPE